MNERKWDYKVVFDDRFKFQNFIKDFILRYCKGLETDAMDCMFRMINVYGIRIDWHEFSYALDALNQIEQIYITQPGGMVKYFIGRKRDDGSQS